MTSFQELVSSVRGCCFGDDKNATLEALAPSVGPLKLSQVVELLDTKGGGYAHAEHKVEAIRLLVTNGCFRDWSADCSQILTKIPFGSSQLEAMELLLNHGCIFSIPAAQAAFAHSGDKSKAAKLIGAAAAKRQKAPSICSPSPTSTSASTSKLTSTLDTSDRECKEAMARSLVEERERQLAVAASEVEAVRQAIALEKAQLEKEQAEAELAELRRRRAALQDKVQPVIAAPSAAPDVPPPMYEEVKKMDGEEKKDLCQVSNTSANRNM
jgi:hypothetical protein